MVDWVLMTRDLVLMIADAAQGIEPQRRQGHKGSRSILGAWLGWESGVLD
jgi:hypothetical protein